MNRKHAYWKRYGHSLTCSNCGHITLFGNYCQKCGAIMDLPEQYHFPKFDIEIPKIITCEYCNKSFTLIDGDINYCPYCGAKIDASGEQ